MKRFTYLTYLGFLALVLFACEKESVTPTKDEAAVVSLNQEQASRTRCVTYSYKDKMQGIVNFGTARTDALIVGFNPDLTLAQRQQILAQYSAYLSLDNDAEVDSGILTIVNLKPGTTCTAVAAMLAHLETRPAVRFAAPVFEPYDPTVFKWQGLTNEVIVTMKNTTSRAALQLMCQQTNTSIVIELSPETFIVSTHKNSAGDALEISTLFNRSAKVYNAEPNLLFQYLPLMKKDNTVAGKYLSKRVEMGDVTIPVHVKNNVTPGNISF
jgi:hypothetical protein